MLYVFLVLAGVASGVLGGMGMGGGTLLIPLLTLIFNFNQQMAQGINLISFSIMALIIIVIHLKNKLVDLKIALFFSGLALTTSFLGAIIANIVDTRHLKIFYGVLLISIAIYQTVCELLKIKSKKYLSN